MAVIFVSYESKRLSSLVNKFMALLLVGSSTFVPNFKKDDQDEVYLKHNLEKETIKVFDTFYGSKHKNINCVDFQKQNLANFSLFEKQNHEKEIISKDSIQKNLQEIWTKKNETPSIVNLFIRNIGNLCSSFD